MLGFAALLFASFVPIRGALRVVPSRSSARTVRTMPTGPFLGVGSRTEPRIPTPGPSGVPARVGVRLDGALADPHHLAHAGRAAPQGPVAPVCESEETGRA
jgi:hypothetical protein